LENEQNDLATFFLPRDNDPTSLTLCQCTSQYIHFVLQKSEHLAIFLMVLSTALQIYQASWSEE